MTIKGPFIRYRCASCGREIERQITAARAVEEIDQLRDGPVLVCSSAACHASLAVVYRQPRS